MGLAERALKDSLNIVYEDEDLLVLNKEPGILVEQTISEELSLSGLAASYAGRSVRPLHRLDRDTSGLAMFALNAKWNRYFSELFEKKRIRKSYWAIVRGDWDGGITKIDTNIASISPGRFGNDPWKGKQAVTTFRKLGSADGYSWIQALPKTGRTHQLRLHCLEAGYPIVGDRFYANDFSNPLLLHARSLAFELPGGSRELSLSAEPPDCWKPWLEKFEKRKKS